STLPPVLKKKLDRHLEDAFNLGRIGNKSMLLRDHPDVGSHQDSVTGHHLTEWPDDTNPLRRQANFLMGLSQRCRGKGPVRDVTLAAGERNLASMSLKAGGA